MAKKFDEVFADIMNPVKSTLEKGAAGASKGDATGVMFEMLNKMIDDITKGSTDVQKNWKAFTTSITDKKGLTDISKNFIGLVSSMDSSINMALSTVLGAADKLAGGVINLYADGNKFVASQFKNIMGGTAGAYSALGNTVQVALNEIGKSFKQIAPEMGESIQNLGSMMNNVITMAGSAFVTLYKDYETKARLAQSMLAQVGGPEGLPKGPTVASDVMKHLGMLGRSEVLKWGQSLAEQGIVADDAITRVTYRGRAYDETISTTMMRIGKTFNMTSEAMSGALDEYMSVVMDATTATKEMYKTFQMAQVAAQGTNIPVKVLEKNIRDATVQARFMNVDFQTVGATMNFLTKNQERFQAAGVSMRKDSAKVLSELTAGTNAWTDSLHAYFGTKGGFEGGPIEGLIRSKFGSTFAESLTRREGGGFEAAKGTGGDMMMQRLDVMKQAMVEASKGAKTEEEALLLQMKVATDTFGMSDVTARTLAMSTQSEIKEIPKKFPELANEMKSSKQLLSELRTSASISENISRLGAKLASKQVEIMLRQAMYLMAIASEAMGVEAPFTKEQLEKGMEKDFDAMGKMIKATTAEMSWMMTPETKKLMGEFVEGTQKIIEKKQIGGMVYPSQTGRNIYSVSEDGRPEFFHGGGGNNMLFSPGGAGRVFNASETMGIFRAGMEGINQAAEPAMTRGGSGNQTTLHLTINAEATKDRIMGIIEDELVNNLVG